MTRGVALSLVVLLATAASTNSRAAGTATNIPGAKLTTISSRGDGRGATLVIEASEPVPYVATRPDPLTVLIDFRNVDTGAVASKLAALTNSPITSVNIEAAESMGSPVSRVRIALAQPFVHHVRAERNRVLVEFSQAVAPRVAAARQTVPAPSAQPTVQSAVDPVAALRLTEPVQAGSTRTTASQVAAGAQSAAVSPTVLLAQTPSQPGSGNGPRRYSGNPVSLDFQQADLRAVLRVFAEISGLNIVIDPAVKGTVDVALRDVPWDQALDIILRANKLGYSVDGTVVRIAPLTTLSEEETQRRKLADDQALSGELRVFTKALSYARAEELQALLTKSVLSRRGTVQVDLRTNTLIISDLQGQLDAAASLITTLDTAQPQVEIEARIVQTTKAFARALGVQWGANGRVDPALGNSTNLAFPNNGSISGRTGGTQGAAGQESAVNLGVGAATSALGLALGSVNGAFNLDVALSALETSGNGRILSTPRVSTLNNVEAEVTQGIQIPLQTISNNTVTVTFKDAALTLKVTPQITAAGTVIMKVSLENATPDFARAAGPAAIPPINTQRALTTLLVSDGQTSVIGGIYTSNQQNSTDRTPGLGQIPILNWLFKRERVDDQSTELLIFITPRIIKS
ncbi:MAG: type IV pilus secretin PilQ [Vicinamibacterales bacterium]